MANSDKENYWGVKFRNKNLQRAINEAGGFKRLTNTAKRERKAGRGVEGSALNLNLGKCLLFLDFLKVLGEEG